MERFLEQLNTIPEVASLTQRVEAGGCPAAVTGLQPVHRACVGAAVAHATGRPVLFVCGDEREAQTVAADLRTLLEKEPVVLPWGRCMPSQAAPLRRWPRWMPSWPGRCLRRCCAV